MMGLAFSSKKEAKLKVPFPAKDYIIETSMFGSELRDNGTFPVCISHDPSRIRNVFGQIVVENGIVVKVK